MKAITAAEDNRRTAAYSALAIAAMPLYLIVPRLIGMALGARDPSDLPLDAQVAEIIAHPNIYASLGLLSLVVGASMMVLALALHVHLQSSAPFAARIATAAGVIGGALFVLAGFGPIITANWLHEINAQDQATAISLYVINQTVTDRLVSMTTVLFGVFALVASLVGARAGLLPRALPYVAALAAIIIVVAVVLPDLWLATVLMMIVWSAWLGASLLRAGRQPAPAATERLGRA